ncbi:MAG: hypothetical protein WBG30_07625, partial [Psychrilyobacter sp.]|uniref:hypothetical protein n=1 Tax=Psychrilyobacter sp. TaxID=2586924 RepID=UPI003C7952BF
HKHDIFSDIIDISNQFFFRGRQGENAIYNKYDMFHIPYDKRYLIGNQRYSMSGHPFLYLGSSIVNVLEELRSDQEKIENVYFSYFYINKNEYKVFDLSNPFNSIFKISSSRIKLKKAQETNKKNNFEKILFKHFFVSICSFEKRNEHEKSKKSKFYEEYVFPQILTQVLRRKKNIDGLLYYSTKLNKVSSENNFFKTKFKENIVLFSRHNKDRHYDKELYDSLKISKPVNISNIIEQNTINIENLKKILVEMKLIENVNQKERIKTIKTKKIEKTEIIQRIIQNYEYEYEQLNVAKNKYLNNKCLEKKCLAEYCPTEKFEKKFGSVCYNDLYINSKLGRIHLFLMHSFISSEKNELMFKEEDENVNK